MNSVGGNLTGQAQVLFNHDAKKNGSLEDLQQGVDYWEKEKAGLEDRLVRYDDKIAGAKEYLDETRILAAREAKRKPLMNALALGLVTAATAGSIALIMALPPMAYFLPVIVLQLGSLTVASDVLLSREGEALTERDFAERRLRLYEGDGTQRAAAENKLTAINDRIHLLKEELEQMGFQKMGTLQAGPSLSVDTDIRDDVLVVDGLRIPRRSLECMRPELQQYVRDHRQR